MAREEKSSVDGLKDKLYSRQDAPQINTEVRTPLSPEQSDIPPKWQDTTVGGVAPVDLARGKSPFRMSNPEQSNNKMSLATKFFIGSVTFFVVALGAAAGIFFLGGNTISPRNIDLEIVAPSLIDGGKETEVEILINNRNQAALQLVDLIINYPEGTRDPANPTQTLTRQRQALGTIASGEQVKRTARAIFYGQEGVEQKITATLEYSVAGSNAIFEKDGGVAFTVGSSPVSIRVSAPAEAISGQSFTVDVVVQSNATTPVTNLVIQGQYPFGFTPTDVNPKADAGNTLWRLGTMTPGSSKTIRVTGTLEGQNGDQRVFRFLAGQDADPTNTKLSVPFLSVPHTISVEKPFITGSIAVNSQTGKIISAPAGRQVNGTITWQNNLSDPVSNVVLKLAFSGPMLDKNSVQATGGFYQSSDNTIIWDKSQNADLATVAPGASGTLEFSFATLPPGTGGTVYTNPTVALALNVSGTRAGQGSVPETVSSAAGVQVNLSSLVDLKASSQYFTNVFQNSGPVPPRAEQNTTYTIVWTVKNSANTIANATVSATLPPYVNFNQAQAGKGVTYNSASRTVTWTIGDLKAGVGYSSPALSAGFQVTLSPSTSQIGQSPTLTSPAILSGQDRFAQVPIQATAEAPTTELFGDSGYRDGMGPVTK